MSSSPHDAFSRILIVKNAWAPNDSPIDGHDQPYINIG